MRARSLENSVTTLRTTTIEALVRIRPLRIAVILTTDTSRDAFLECVELLSAVWGGRFARMIYVDMYAEAPRDDLSAGIKAFLPEVVIFPTEKEQVFLHVVAECCRAEFVTVTPGVLDDVRSSSVAGLISFREVLHDELTRYPDLERSNVYLLEHNEADELLPLLAATFGLIPGSHARDYGEQLNARTQSGAIDSYLSYLELVSSMSHRKGWLHLVNRNLGVTRSAWYPPTVVVVAKSQPLRDLALFWNLRDHLAPRAFGNSILLIPEEEIENPPSLQRLAKELARSEIGSNHCMVRSAGCPKAILDVLARRLRPRLTRTKTEAFHVDVQFGPKVPGIYCGAREQTVTLAIADDIVTIPQLEPGFSRLQALSRWACDLTKDLSTNRYPFELDLPKTRATLDLLNLPPGPFVHFGDRLSFGPEFLSVLMTESSQASTLRIRLPSAHELFEVVLAAGRVTVLNDEKNIRYTQTLSLFGDLSTACAALTCAPGRVLDALYEKANPLTYEEICGLSRAGKRGRRAALPKMASLILQRLEGTSRKIAERRVRTAMGEALAHDTPTDEVLRLLSAKGVIRRRWKLDRCGSCDHSYWLTAIDLSQPLLCPGCGRPVLLKNAVAVGYALNALARLALKEGFRPVVLTARFLERLGLSGFIWHAGAKIEHQVLLPMVIR